MKKIYFNTEHSYLEYLTEAEDLGYEKTWLKTNNVIKIFNTRGFISSGFIRSFSSRIIKNAHKLNKLQIPSLKISEELVFQYDKRKSGVVYKYIPGCSIRDLPTTDITKDLVTNLAKFIAEFHQKGVYFRAMHLGNIIYYNKTFSLIDVAKIHFYPWPLFILTRARAFRRLIKYKKDIAHFKQSNLELLLSRYSQESHFSKCENLLFNFYLNMMQSFNYKTIKLLIGFVIFMLILLWLI